MESASDVGLGDEGKQFLIRTLNPESSESQFDFFLEAAIFYTFQISISLAQVDIDECLVLDWPHSECSICLDEPRTQIAAILLYDI